MTSLPISLKIARRLSHWISKNAEATYMRRSLHYVGVQQGDAVYSFTTKAELNALYTLALACPVGADVLEIGSYLGASTCYIAAGLSHGDGHLFCVDTWQNETMPDGIRDTFTEFQENTAVFKDMLTLLRKRSDEIASNDIPAALHLVFIDGDHSYDACRHDFHMVTPWLSEDGTIAFHDSNNYSGVSRVIGEALATGKWSVAGHVGSLLWMRRAVWFDKEFGASPSAALKK